MSDAYKRKNGRVVIVKKKSKQRLHPGEKAARRDYGQVLANLKRIMHEEW
jgi:hypothetical protein